ncbi:MAG: amidohydrolase family protein [Myxococcota bacterium]
MTKSGAAGAPSPGHHDPDPTIPVCAATLPAQGRLLAQGALDDPEGAHVPDHLPQVVDAHVHLFPDPLFEAIWRWFDTHGWPIRYKLKTPAVIAYLLQRGVSHLVALHYSHKPGIARGLNAYMAEVVSEEPRVTGLATVYPGEPESRTILEEAFTAGLSGVKLHCHVQAFAPDTAPLEPVYEACVAAQRPLVIHAGREPSSPAYPVDTYAVCAVERIEAVLRSYPSLKLCVPHLGADEFEGYARLLERYDNLWLDTTMSGADYFNIPFPMHAVEARPERIMYGTDFPNIPYAWDRELTQLARRWPEETLEAVLGGNARRFFDLPAPTA